MEEFLASAGEFLAAREAENNLLFGISSFVRSNPELLTEGPPQFATVSDGDGRVVAASLRTPPHNQVLSWIDDLDAVDVLVDAVRNEPLPGVVGPTKPAARFAARWTDMTGQPAHVEVAERTFRLARVIPPERPATGSWRFVEARDRDLIADWLVAFSLEAMPEARPSQTQGRPRSVGSRESDASATCGRTAARPSPSSAPAERRHAAFVSVPSTPRLSAAVGAMRAR